MRILIVRLSHLGDCVLTLPVVAAIRQQVPSAWIAWAIEPAGRRLLEGQPGIDHFEVVPRGWLRRPGELPGLRRRLRELRIDASLDPQSLIKSAGLAWLSGARRRVGFGGRYGRELSPWLNNVRIHPQTRHLVDRSLELLTGIGLRPEGAPPVLHPRPEATQKIQTWLDEQGLRSPFIVINPGASWPSKRWVMERHGLVARHCGETWQLPVIVTWAGDEERQWAEQIVAAGGRWARLAPPTSLPELTALLALAQLFVGSDSGPMHIAAAVGCPCVALFGPTLPEESGPYGAGHSTLQAWHQTGTARERRAAENLALRDISVAEVCTAVEQQLASAANKKK